MAFTGIAALVAGEAVTAAVVLTAVAEVGMVMTVVGAVTGNKDLMKIGGVLGLVGGIGGLINGAVSGATAAAGTVESLEGASAMADAAFGGAGAAEASQLAGIEAMGSEVVISSAMEGGLAGTPELAGTLSAPNMEMAAGTQASPSMQVGPPVTNVQPAVTDVANQSSTLGNVGPEAVQAPTTPLDRNGSDLMSDNFAGKGAGGFGAPKTSNAFWSSMGQFVTNNQSLIGGVMQGVGKGYEANRKYAMQERMMNTANSAGRYTPGIIAGAQR